MLAMSLSSPRINSQEELDSLMSDVYNFGGDLEKYLTIDKLSPSPPSVTVSVCPKVPMVIRTIDDIEDYLVKYFNYLRSAYTFMKFVRSLRVGIDKYQSTLYGGRRSEHYIWIKWNLDIPIIAQNDIAAVLDELAISIDYPKCDIPDGMSFDLMFA